MRHSCKQVRKVDLLQKEDGLKLQLAEMEEALLAALSASQGNILQNQPLLDSLTDIKTKSTVVAEALAESIRLQQALDGERDVYLPLAQQGSKLFFVLCDLARVNNMYQYSLAAFLDLYDRTLKVSTSGGQAERIRQLVVVLVQIAYEFICQSLFRCDRLTFAMMLLRGMCPEQFESGEWELLTGQTPVDLRTAEKGPGWVPTARAAYFNSLAARFPAYVSSLQLKASEIWGLWASHPRCEEEFPSAVQRQLRPAQQLLLVQAVRPDRFMSSLARVCTALLQLPAATAPSLRSLATRAEMPILIIVSPGTDPTAELQDLAAAAVGRDRFHQVALGQGQLGPALQQLHECARAGDWLLLKNLHLVSSWLPTLEKEVNALQPRDTFRLWLTSEAHPKFSPVLLQSSLKVQTSA